MKRPWIEKYPKAVCMAAEEVFLRDEMQLLSGRLDYKLIREVAEEKEISYAQLATACRDALGLTSTKPTTP